MFPTDFNSSLIENSQRQHTATSGNCRIITISPHFPRFPWVSCFKDIIGWPVWECVQWDYKQETIKSLWGTLRFLLILLSSIKPLKCLLVPCWNWALYVTSACLWFGHIAFPTHTLEEKNLKLSDPTDVYYLPRTMKCSPGVKPTIKSNISTNSAALFNSSSLCKLGQDEVVASSATRYWI